MAIEDLYFGLIGPVVLPIWRQAFAGGAPPSPDTVKDTPEGVLRARIQLGVAAIGLAGVVAAPAIYSAYLGSKRGKRKKKASVERMGVSLENASAQMTGLLMTAIAAPAISTAAAYIGVQKLEDAHIISRGLGNAAQGLLTVAAAGPAIAGIGQVAQSAFLKGK